MDEKALVRIRQQMGRSVVAVAEIPGGRSVVDASGWQVLTGRPLPDMNMVLVHGGAAERLDEIVEGLTDLPALVMLAGPALEHAGRMTEPWLNVGTLPIMTRDLTGLVEVADPRVRRALPDDCDAVCALVGEAFGMPGADMALMFGPATSGEGPLRAWLLEDDGELVSALVSGHVDDIVSLWSMATPARLGRRGYGRVLLKSVLAHAQAEGVRTGLLGATPAGLPLYSATGWATVEEWHIYTNAGSAQFAA